MLFAEILGEFVCYAQSKEDLVDEVNSVIKEDNEKFGYNDPLLSLENLEDKINAATTLEILDKKY